MANSNLNTQKQEECQAKHVEAIQRWHTKMNFDTQERRIPSNRAIRTQKHPVINEKSL